MSTGNSIKACEWKRLHRLTARCLFVALAPLALDGCLSIEVDRTRPKTTVADAPCSLETRLYEKGKDVKKDVKSTREVTWKLFHLDTSPVVPAREGQGAVWSATDLKAGNYRLAASWGPKPNVPGDTSAGSGEESFALVAGEHARADVVLKEFPGWGWAVIAVVIGAVIAGIVIAVTAESIAKGLSGESKGARPAFNISSAPSDPNR